jgi:hypothetical protein
MHLSRHPGPMGLEVTRMRNGSLQRARCSPRAWHSSGLELTMLGNPRYVRGCNSLLRACGRAPRPARVAGAALVAGVVASIGFGISLAVAQPLSALGPDGPVAGTIFVANAGLIPRSTGGIGPGSITAYCPGTTGDAGPEIVITKGVHGPGGLTVDARRISWGIFSQVSNRYARPVPVSCSLAPTAIVLPEMATE